MKMIKALLLVMSCVYRLMLKSHDFSLQEISTFEDAMANVQDQINRLEED